MITNLENLEVIGTGKLERIVMARLRMDVDVLRGSYRKATDPMSLSR
jgi:hypothetical protein